MKIYYLSFILIALSCSTSHKRDIDTITINYDDTKDFPLSTFIQTYDIIRLASSDSILTGEISDIEFYNDHIFILDKKNNNLQIFNLKGEFIRQLSKTGRGPGEYLYLNDIEVNSQGIYLLDYSQQKIILYDFELHFQKEFHFPFYVSEFRCINDNIIIYSEKNGEKEDYQFYLTDNNGQTRNKYLPRNINQGNNTFVSSNIFTRNDNRFILSPRYGNTLYTLKDTTLLPLYTLDFKDKTLPENHTDIKRHDISSNKFPYITRRHVFLCKENLLIDYINQDNRYFYHYNTHTRESQNGQIVNDLIPAFRFFPRFAKDNKIIDWIDAASLLEYFPQVVLAHPILHDLKENDNPILFIYHPK